MAAPKRNRLDSWGEIAQYLRCDGTTAWRWEKSRGLPVHRLPGGRRNAVFAYTDEIDAWRISAENGGSNTQDGRATPSSNVLSDSNGTIGAGATTPIAPTRAEAEVDQDRPSLEKAVPTMSSGRSSGPNWTRIRQNCLLLFAILAWAALLVDALILRSLVVHPLRDLALGILATASSYWHARRSKRADTTRSSGSQVAAFRGLLPFEPGDADRFYGRELEATALAGLIGHSQYQFGVLYGDSGCGKTSLVQAGVLPRLEASCFWAIVCRSYGNPLKSIITACRKRSSINPDKNENFLTYLGRVIEKSRSGLVIVCDQFEEFYVSSPNKQDWAPFLELLAECARSSFPTTVKFLFIVRSDFLHFVISSFDEYLPDALVASRRYHLQQFDEQQADEVIERSVRKAQWPIEAGLSRAIAQDLAVNGTVLPSELQIVGEQLQNKRLFSLERYVRAGGKEQLVHGYLEDVIKLTGEAETAQLVLRCLISEEDTRLTLPLSEIQRRVQRSEQVVGRIVKFFVQMRLIREIRQDEPWRYELMHEYLIGKINQTTGKIMDATQRANRYFRQYLSNYEIDKHTRIPITRLWSIHRHSDLQRNEQSRRLLRKSLFQGLLWTGATVIALGIFVVLAAAWLSVTESWDEVLLNDGHTAGVHRAVFSPDGRLLVSCGEDAKIIVWDFARRLKVATLTGHAGWVNALTFSPDGKWFATGGYDNKVIVWNAATFAQERVLSGQGGRIGALAVSSDGTLLAVVTDSGGTAVWNTFTWSNPLILPAKRDYGAAWFSADGRQLFISGSGWWDLATAQLVHQIGIDGGWDAVSPGGKTVVSVTPSGLVGFMDVTTHRVTAAIKAHQDNGRGVAYSPDGRLVATGADNIVLWDGVSHKKIVRLSYPSIVWALTFSPDGRWLVSTHGDGSILVWDPFEHELVANLNGHSAPVYTVAYSHDGRYIASAGEDDSVILWDSGSRRKEAVLLGHTNKVMGIAFSPDGKAIASTDFWGGLNYWDLSSHRPRWTKTGSGGASTYCLAISPNGHMVATPISVYSTEDGSKVAQIDLDSWAVAFSPDSRWLAYEFKGDLVVWDSRSQKMRTFKSATGTIVTLNFSPDGKLLVAGEDEGVVRVWQVDPFRELVVLGRHGSRVKSVIFSPDGEEIASAGDDHVINLWSLKSRRHITAIGIHASPVLSLAFSPDGKHLVSGEHDNTVRLYTRHRSLWGHQLD